MDMKFDWDPSMEMGIPEIDEQHKELFRIAREIERLIITQADNPDRKAILEGLCEVRDYVTYHFYTEENIIRERAIEQLESHKASHDAFLDQIQAIDCDALVANPVQELARIKMMIQDWLFQHILVEDRAIPKA